MEKSRRQFLTVTSAGLIGAAVAHRASAQSPEPQQKPTPGAPPAFGTGPLVGPKISPSTVSEAEKLVQITMTDREVAVAAASWQPNMAALYERRAGPRKVELEATLAPATKWNPVLADVNTAVVRDRFVRSTGNPGPLPTSDEDIAYAPVTRLSRWIERRELTSTRLTQIYLKRLQQFDPKLRCVITLTTDHAMARAKQADAEIATGKYRGPLHGIPWGSKDLLDTAGIPTTYGAEPYRNRVPKEDAAVVRRLDDAGAVLVAKLSLGALALNDIWFGGQTMNPWLLEEGASGSSAGPGSATAAGLVGFSIDIDPPGGGSKLGEVGSHPAHD